MLGDPGLLWRLWVHGHCSVGHKFCIIEFLSGCWEWTETCHFQDGDFIQFSKYQSLHPLNYQLPTTYHLPLSSRLLSIHHLIHAFIYLSPILWSIFPSISPPTIPFIYYLSSIHSHITHPSIHLSHPSVYLFAYSCTHTFIYSSTCSPTHLSVHPSIILSIHWSFYASYLFVHPSICSCIHYPIIHLPSFLLPMPFLCPQGNRV